MFQNAEENVAYCGFEFRLHNLCVEHKLHIHTFDYGEAVACHQIFAVFILNINLRLHYARNNNQRTYAAFAVTGCLDIRLPFVRVFNRRFGVNRKQSAEHKNKSHGETGQSSEVHCQTSFQ